MFARLVVLLVQLSTALCLQSGTAPSKPATECVHDRKAAFANWKHGKASMWYFHITHNAGTSLRSMMERSAPLASNRLEGASDIKELQMGHIYYDNLAGESGLRSVPLEMQVPCTSDRFLSVIAVRDPIPRILTRDGAWTTTGTNNVDRCNTDNYGLRKLIGKPFGEPLNASDLDFAKRRLESFDFVLDVAEVNTSIGALCGALGFKTCDMPLKRASTRQDVLAEVGHKVYQVWMERNAPERALYEYAKKLAHKRKGEHPSMPVTAPSSREKEEEEEDGDVRRAQGALSWMC